MTSHDSGCYKPVTVSAVIFLASKSDAYNNMRNAKVVPHYIPELDFCYSPDSVLASFTERINIKHFTRFRTIDVVLSREDEVNI